MSRSLPRQHIGEPKQMPIYKHVALNLTVFWSVLYSARSWAASMKHVHADIASVLRKISQRVIGTLWRLGYPEAGMEAARH